MLEYAFQVQCRDDLASFMTFVTKLGEKENRSQLKGSPVQSASVIIEVHLNIDGIFLVTNDILAVLQKKDPPTGIAQGLKAALSSLENVKHFPCLLPFAEEH